MEVVAVLLGKNLSLRLHPLQSLIEKDIYLDFQD